MAIAASEKGIGGKGDKEEKKKGSKVEVVRDVIMGGSS